MPSEERKFRPFEWPPAFVLSLSLSFMIIFGVACVVAYKTYTKAIDATIRSNETRATLLSKLILEHQRAAIGILQSYADRPLLVESVKRRDFEGALRHLVNLAKNNPEMDWPFISNPDSTVWVNYPVDKQVMNKDLSYRDWYRGVKKEWKPYSSSVYKLIVGEKDLAVAVSVPILDEKGEVIGILSTAQSAGFFRKIIGEVGLNLDAKITLIDQEGHIIYSNRFPYTKEVIVYPPLGFLGKALKGEKGDVEVRDASDQGKIKYISFVPIEGIGWSIIVEKARSEVLRSEFSSLVLIGFVSLLIYGVVVLFSVHLRERRRRIEGLEKLTEELDGRVRDRTAELEAGNRALRESEERFRTLANATFEGIGISEHGRIVDGNEQLVQIIGGTRSELIGQEVVLLIAPEDRDRVMASILNGMENQTEHRMFRRDGTPIIVETHGRTIAHQGRQVRITAIRDITERKRAEEALRESQTLLSAIMENTPDPVYVKDNQSRIIMANPALAKVVGKPLKEILGKTDSEYYGDLDTGQALREHDLRVMKSEQSEVMEETVPTPDGYRTFLSSKTPYRNASGDIIGITGISRDITERKKTEVELRESRKKYQALIETTGDFIWEMDSFGRYAYCSPQMETLWGLKPEEMIGKTPFDVMPAEHKNNATEFFVGLVKSPRPFSGLESAAYDGHGRLIYIETSGVPFLDDEGKLLGFRGISRDITDRKRTEEALQQRTSELQRLAETLEERVKQRTEELASLSSQLVSAQENERRRISYDLHDNVWQTLVAIRFEIERLFSRQDRADRAVLHNKSKEIMADILGTVGKIRSMQGDLWPYVLDDIGLLATVDWYCREFEKNHPGLTIEKKNGLAENEIPSSVKIVIYRILQEALSNVAKHSQANHVTLQFNKNDHRMEFTIEDNGIGFDLEETVAKRSPWGRLGLLSIKARTELSGGLFEVESVMGKGTTVRASWRF